MFLALLAGLMVGGGLWLALAVLHPAATPLAIAARRLDRVESRALRPEADHGSIAARAGRFVISHIGDDRFRISSLARDLAIAGRPMDVHVGQKVLWAMAAGSAAPLASALATLSGAHLNLAFPAWMALLGGVGGFVVPDASVRQLAATRRREFRQSLSAYIDLVVMLLAANEGVTGALEHAAAAGDSWAFHELRRALAEARLTATTPWQAMREMGERLGVDELIELSSAAHLAGHEGASVRQSLIAKARTLRDRALSAEEAEAERASTRMVFPLLLLVLSFVLFVGYPAFVSVLST